MRTIRIGVGVGLAWLFLGETTRPDFIYGYVFGREPTSSAREKHSWSTCSCRRR